MNPKSTTCSIPNCASLESARGYCGKHYQRWLKYGDPEKRLLLRGEPAPVRFWTHVNKDGSVPPHCPELGPCWVWTANQGRGYGRFSLRTGRSVQAHRYSYELMFGAIPDGVDILHRCDNPPCVRPTHLFPGNNSINMLDMHAKGRGVSQKGEGNYQHKLTTEQVIEIRRRYAAGNISQRALAVEFGVWQPHIGLIIRGKRWPHVTV